MPPIATSLLNKKKSLKSALSFNPFKNQLTLIDGGNSAPAFWEHRTCGCFYVPREIKAEDFMSAVQRFYELEIILSEFNSILEYPTELLCIETIRYSGEKFAKKFNWNKPTYLGLDDDIALKYVKYHSQFEQVTDWLFRVLSIYLMKAVAGEFAYTGSHILHSGYNGQPERIKNTTKRIERLHFLRFNKFLKFPAILARTKVKTNNSFQYKTERMSTLSFSDRKSRQNLDEVPCPFCNSTQGIIFSIIAWYYFHAFKWSSDMFSSSIGGLNWGQIASALACSFIIREIKIPGILNDIYSKDSIMGFPGMKEIIKARREDINTKILIEKEKEVWKSLSLKPVPDNYSGCNCDFCLKKNGFYKKISNTNKQREYLHDVFDNLEDEFKYLPTKETFIDHVLDLQHNNGTCLNKGWIKVPNTLKHFLDKRASGEPETWMEIYLDDLNEVRRSIKSRKRNF